MEKKLKNIIITLSVIAAALLCVLAYVWFDRQGMIKDLNIEKEDLTAQMIQLQEDYAMLSSNNDTLNHQLDIEREKVQQLIDRFEKTEATNRAQIRKYEKELGTLRSIMRNYIVQIDSLNTLNMSLRKDAEEARKAASESMAKYEDLKTTTEEYAKQVKIGSVLKGRELSLTAITAKNKETERSSRVDKLKACITLVENDLAAKGATVIYIRVKDPEGILMTEDSQQIFNMNGEQMIYSASREIDYQGSEVEACIYFDSPQKFVKGVYTVEAYTENGQLGTADLLLR